MGHALIQGYTATPDHRADRAGLRSRQSTLVAALTFEEIGDRAAVEVCRFKYGRISFSIRQSAALGNLGVWLPLNYEDRFVGAIERADSRLPVIRVCRLTDWLKTDSDLILQAALAAYDAFVASGGRR